MADRGLGLVNVVNLEMCAYYIQIVPFQSTRVHELVCVHKLVNLYNFVNTSSRKNVWDKTIPFRQKNAVLAQNSQESHFNLLHENQMVL
ncbi:hypothetical protein DXA58_01630 [Bacteroides uniformis]|nr:hypothetical protein DXA58_01630 [Bacteroides uniformis]